MNEKPTALVVEDDDAIRLVIASTLMDEGFAVIEAQSGADAVDIATSGRELSLVVTDVSMPGAVDGFELSHKIRRDRPDVGIVVFSGNSLPQVGSLPEGVPFLRKPFSMGTLLLTVRTVMLEQPC